MPIFIANVFAAIARNRPAREAAAPRSPALLDPVHREPAAAQAEILADLSLPRFLILTLAVFGVAFVCIEFSHLSNLVGPVWPSNAILLFALLRSRHSLRNYGLIFIAGLIAMWLAGVAAGTSPALVPILALADLGEVAVAATLLSLFRIDAFNLTTFRGLLIFIAVAGGVAPLGSAVVCAKVFGLTHGIPWSMLWRNWYVGHALGMIIVTPFLISVTSREWRALRFSKRLPEAASILALFILLGAAGAFFRPFIFVTAPIILFATVRFGLIGATVATMFTALFATAFTVTNFGPALIQQFDLSQRILALQVFLAITSFWSLPTSALLSERDQLLNDLSRANAQLTVESERKSDLVTGLRRHLTMAEEKERLRLSHELHDQAGQGLIAAILELNEIDPLLSGPARERSHLVRRKMEELGKTLHRIAWELRPASIDELGLRKALASYVADWGERCGIEVDFHCDDADIAAVPNEIGTAVYRIVQEALTNVVKHAQRPSSVSVIIARSEAILQVIVEDNGCGFDPGALAAKPGSQRGLGLDGMRERLELIGGSLEIESVIGGGTTLFARVAVDRERSAA